MTIQEARKIADGDIADTFVQTLSDAFDVLRKSSERAHVNRIADFQRAQRIWTESVK